MLTCKSLFGLGYRGERLIEPSTMKCIDSNALRWLRVPPVREVLVGLGHTSRRQGPIVGKTVKVRGSVARLSVGPKSGETLAGTRVRSPWVS